MQTSVTSQSPPRKSCRQTSSEAAVVTTSARTQESSAPGDVTTRIRLSPMRFHAASGAPVTINCVVGTAQVHAEPGVSVPSAWSLRKSSTSGPPQADSISNVTETTSIGSSILISPLKGEFTRVSTPASRQVLFASIPEMTTASHASPIASASASD